MAQPQPTIKPVNPKINWGNPITEGLVFDAPFFEGAGTKTKDRVNNADIGTVAASGATWDRNFYGIDLDFSAAASSINYTTPSQVNSLSTMSVETLVYYRSNGGGGLGRIINKGTGTGPTTYWFVFMDVGNVVTFARGFSSAGENWATSTGLTANTWNHIVLTWNISSASGTAPTIYFNGVPQSISNSVPASGTPATDTTELYIGNRASATRNFDGKIAYSRIWNRIITPTEVWSLYSDPWQIYSQTRMFTFGAGPVFTWQQLSTLEQPYPEKVEVVSY